jgi:Fanconi anemia group M protein
MAAKQLFDIFSRPKKIRESKKEENQKIIVDYREKNSLVASELIGMNFKIEFRELKVADYLVNNVAIERKTISDFISSMINRRIIRQLQELQQYENKLLMIEGIDEQELYSDDANERMVHANAIRGFLLSVALRYKIPIILTKNYEDTARFIAVLARKKEKESSLNVIKKSLNKKERLQFILESFPGIGPKTAKKLLEKFKTLKNIVNSSVEELTEVIGKKADIFRLIEETY